MVSSRPRAPSWQSIFRILALLSHLVSRTRARTKRVVKDQSADLYNEHGAKQMMPPSFGQTETSAQEGTADSDSDGIPDALDPDSDGDGKPDAEKAPPPLPDGDNACTPTYDEARRTYYNMGVMNIPYGNDAAGKFNNAKWYQAICNAAGLIPTGCARSDPPFSYAKAVYGAGEAYGCNPSSSLMGDCGWQNVITFHKPPKDSSDSTENIDDYGLCGRSCTISNTTGWSPICMTAGNYYVNTYNWIGTGRTGWTGGYGGSCTCPDGQVYQVGDDNNSCNSMSKGCVGGTATSCYKSSGKWSYGKVTCATHTPLLG